MQILDLTCWRTALNSYPSKQRGIALLLCLFFMLIFSVAAIMVSEHTAKEIKVSSAFEQKLQARFTAKSLLNQLLYAFYTDSEFVDNEGIPINWAFDGSWNVVAAGTRVRVMNESSLISYGGIDKDARNRLLESIARDDFEFQPQVVIDSLKDWQDSDSESQFYGKELSQREGDIYLPRNSPIKTNAELKFIQGVTPELYRYLSEWFLVVRPLAFNYENTLPHIKQSLGDEPTEQKNKIERFIVIDIEIKTELQSLNVRYLVDLWYDNPNPVNVIDYVR